MPPSSSAPAVLLVVEDENGTRKALTLALRRRQFTVLEAATGHEAQTALAQEPKIDLIIADCNVPGATVAELCRTFSETSSPGKFLATSGYAREYLLAAGTLPAHLPFLKKPFSTAQLYSAVESLLSPSPAA